MSETEQGTSTATENRWRWRPERNPYLHNIFTLLGLDDPRTSDAEFVKRLKALQMKLRYNKSDPVFGCTPTQTDVAAAQNMQTDTNLLAQEQLLVHTRHGIDPEELGPFVSAFTQVEIAPAEEMLPLPLSNIDPIVKCFPEPRQISSDAIEPPDLSCLAPLLRPDPAQERILPR